MDSQRKSAPAGRLNVLDQSPPAVPDDAGPGSNPPRCDAGGVDYPADPGPPPPTVQILEGDVLYREWVPGPAGPRGWLFGAVLSAAALVGSASFAARGGWMAIPMAIVALVAAALLITALNFRGLRIKVDRHGIAWGFGLFRKRFAHEEVSMFRGRVFGFAESGAGGWGIGRAQDGMDIYQVWGANGTALDLIVKRGGTTEHYLVSSAAPDRLAAAMVRAFTPTPEAAPNPPAHS